MFLIGDTNVHVTKIEANSWKANVEPDLVIPWVTIQVVMHHLGTLYLWSKTQGVTKGLGSVNNGLSLHHNTAGN